MQALITGAGGFVGGYLCKFLVEHTDWNLLGTVYPGPVEEAHPHPRLSHVWLDLRDPEEVARLVASFRPDVVFHLAAQSVLATSFADPWNTLENNVRGQLNLLEAIRLHGLPTRFLVIGTSEEYGTPLPEELPLTEEVALRPASPYAVSKVAQDLLGLQYHLAYGIDVVRVRPFNHTGPGRPPHFVVPAFASQIASIEAGLQEPVLKVGNLDAARDFTDVRDVVRAYYLTVMHGESGEVYNIASGQPQSIRELLDTLLSLSTANIQVTVDPDRYRPVDVPTLFGSAEKLRRCTGWEPDIPFEQTLHDVLDYWRLRINRPADVSAGG